jgi:uncharacterized membrane protein
MLEMGILVALGLLVTLAKAPWAFKLWCTSHPLVVDATVFVALISIHWGTFSGVMVATIGAFFCSLTLSAARWLIGHNVNGKYIPGKFNIAHKVKS